MHFHIVRLADSMQSKHTEKQDFHSDEKGASVRSRCIDDEPYPPIEEVESSKEPEVVFETTLEGVEKRLQAVCRECTRNEKNRF